MLVILTEQELLPFRTAEFIPVILVEQELLPFRTAALIPVILVEQELLPFVQLSSFSFFSGVHVASLVFCGSLFVFTSFLFCPWCRLFISDLRLLITLFTSITRFLKRTKRRDTRKGNEKL